MNKACLSKWSVTYFIIIIITLSSDIVAMVLNLKQGRKKITFTF